VAVNPATNKIYVANVYDGAVTVMDRSADTTTTVLMGANPAVVAVNRATNKIYIANNGTLALAAGVTLAPR